MAGRVPAVRAEGRPAAGATLYVVASVAGVKLGARSAAARTKWKVVP